MLNPNTIYEYLDTKFGRGKGNAFFFDNLSFRVLVRGGYLAATTFIAALLPVIGDAMSLTGAWSTFPLTFFLAHHMYLTGKKNILIHIDFFTANQKSNQTISKPNYRFDFLFSIFTKLCSLLKRHRGSCFLKNGI